MTMAHFCPSCGRQCTCPATTVTSQHNDKGNVTGCTHDCKADAEADEAFQRLHEGLE